MPSSDFTKTFYIIGDKQDRRCYQYIINVGQQAIPLVWVNWCKSNLINPCGWWFDTTTAYMGFNDERESVWFKLACMGSPDER